MDSLKAQLDAISEKLAHDSRPQALVECILSLAGVILQQDAALDALEERVMELETRLQAKEPGGLS